MGTIWTGIGRCAALCVAASSLAASPPAPESDLVGLWRGPIRHNGQESEFALRFERGAEGLRAHIAMPALDAWDAFAVPAEVVDRTIRLAGGWWTLDWSGETISGTLPGELVPVYEISFTLRRGKISSPTPETSIPPAEPLWTRSLGSPIWAGLAAEEGLLLAASDNGVLTALDPGTGEVRWSFDTEWPIRATPTLTPEGILVHSDSGMLFHLDRADGMLRWQVRISQELTRGAVGGQGDRYHHYSASARLEGRTIFLAGSDGVVHALAADSGEEIWRFETGDAVASTPALEAGRLFVGSFDGKVYALDALTGRQLWVHDTGAAIAGSPDVADGLVLVGSRSYELIALRAEDGSVAWRTYHWFSWVESSPVIDNGTVFVGLSDGQALVASSLESGSELWRFDSAGSVWSKPAVEANIVVVGAVGVADYFVPHRGGLFAVDRQTGRLTWGFQSQAQGPRWGFGSSPVIAGDRVFAADLDGNVYAFALEGR